MMTSRSLRKRRTQLRVRSMGGYVYDDDVEEEEQELEEMIKDDDGGTSSREREKEMQIVCYSEPAAEPFTLPDDWFVEQKPRPSNPSHVDKYYYEPGTGKKFRSLLAVQRYLKTGTRDCRTTQRMMSENKNTTYIEHGTGQQRFRSLRTIERYVTAENACTATPKQVVKAGTRNQSPCGLRSWQRAVRKRSSMTEEKKDRVTLEPLKHSVQSTHPNKSDSLKKINLAKDNTTTSMHNLSRAPEKVTWVLSGPGGFWSPYVDDSIVPESDKLKWSEAFVLSIHERH